MDSRNCGYCEFCAIGNYKSCVENNSFNKDILDAFDKVVFLELPHVTHVSYDSHEICKYFAENLRKRLKGER